MENEVTVQWHIDSWNANQQGPTTDLHSANLSHANHDQDGHESLVVSLKGVFWPVVPHAFVAISSPKKCRNMQKSGVRRGHPDNQCVDLEFVGLQLPSSTSGCYQATNRQHVMTTSRQFWGPAGDLKHSNKKKKPRTTGLFSKAGIFNMFNDFQYIIYNDVQTLSTIIQQIRNTMHQRRSMRSFFAPGWKRRSVTRHGRGGHSTSN